MLDERPYLFLASMDVDPRYERRFVDLYDGEHIPSLREVPGVLSAARFTTQSFRLAIENRVVGVGSEGEPKYAALYELTGPDVLLSSEWAEAVERGDWPMVRPHTRNRRHVLLRPA